jgi:hypothetical protein
MAAGQDEYICEIFADTDSEYDEEFEGFDINVDDDENMEVIENRDYKIFTINKNVDVVTN